MPAKGGRLCVHGDDTWTRFDCGMTEFLRRVLSADSRAKAMKDSALWGAGLRRLYGHSLLVRIRQDINRQVREAAQRTRRLPAPIDT